MSETVDDAAVEAPAPDFRSATERSAMESAAQWEADDAALDPNPPAAPEPDAAAESDTRFGHLNAAAQHLLDAVVADKEDEAARGLANRAKAVEGALLEQALSAYRRPGAASDRRPVGRGQSGRG